jgi:hypothetical protein
MHLPAHRRKKAVTLGTASVMLETIDPSVVYLDVGLLVAISSFTITDVWDKDTPFNFHTEPPSTSFQDPDIAC